MIAIWPDAKWVGLAMIVTGVIPLLWIIGSHALEWLHGKSNLVAEDGRDLLQITPPMTRELDLGSTSRKPLPFSQMSDIALGAECIELARHFTMKDDKTETTHFVNAQQMYAEAILFNKELRDRGFMQATIAFSEGDTVKNFNNFAAYLTQLGTFLSRGQTDTARRFALSNAYSVTGSPTSIAREQRLQDKQDIKRLEIETAQQPVPDMPIHDVFFHIRPDVLENHKEVRWQKVGDDLRDKLSTGELLAWGREIDPATKQVSALIPIPAGYWAKAEFVYFFLAEDRKREEPHSYTPGNTPTRNDYADIQFNHLQIFRIWPQKFKKIGVHINIPEKPRSVVADHFTLRGVMENARRENLEVRVQEARERARIEAERVADFQAWDRVPILTLREAAYLWAGERPVGDINAKLSQMAEVVLAELIDAGNANALPIQPKKTPESDWERSAAVLDDLARQITGSTAKANSRSRVTRADLRGYAESKGERPAFLFPEDR